MVKRVPDSVYILKCKYWNTRYYKVWVSSNDLIKKRIQELQVWNPKRIELAICVPVLHPYLVENIIHIIYKHNNTSWEWFQLTYTQLNKLIWLTEELSNIEERYLKVRKKYLNK